MFDRLFIDHPRTVNESYGEHLRAASSFALTMILGGIACLIHALVPGLFVHTGSKAIRGLHDRMIVNRRHCRLNDETVSSTPRQG